MIQRQLYSVFTRHHSVNSDSGNFHRLPLRYPRWHLKVGSYTSTGSNINVDCGFTTGARFVLIKQSEPTLAIGTSGILTRGIVGGNDPFLLLTQLLLKSLTLTTLTRSMQDLQ